MSTLDTNPKLVDSVYTALGTDRRPAADVYAENQPKVLNSMQRLASKLGFSETLADLIRGGKEIAKYFPIVRDAYGAVTKGNVFDRVMASTDLLRGLGDRVPGEWGETIGNFYNDYGDYISTVGEVSSIVNGTDFKNLQSVGGMINRLSNSDAAVLFSDQDGLSGLMVSVVSEATRYGIPNSFDTLVDTLENSDQILKIANGCLPIAIDAGDFQMLRSINRHMSSGSLISATEGILHEVSDRYGSRLGQTFQEGVQIYDDILTTYSEVNATWNQYTRLGASSGSVGPGGMILDASVFNRASLDLSELGKQSTPEPAEWEDMLVYIGSAFEPTDVRKEINHQFPSRVTMANYVIVDRYLP